MRGRLTKVACLISMLIGSGFLSSSLAFASKIEERPSPLVMVADAVFARPIMVATGIAGSALYVLTLPVSLTGGNAAEAGRGLVLTPFRSAFMRCLGCTRKNAKNPHYYYDN